MGTNYYVNAASCANACEHCTETERLHLGKASAGWRFLFYAEPEWPRDEAFAHWIRRALSGPIADEYGHEITLVELVQTVDAMANGISHTNDKLQPNRHAFRSCGHDFSDRKFS